MTGFSINGLNFPKRIGNKTAFQQARNLSRQHLCISNRANIRISAAQSTFPKRLLSFEWSNMNFAIDKAISRLIRPDRT